MQKPKLSAMAAGLCLFTVLAPASATNQSNPQIQNRPVPDPVFAKQIFIADQGLSEKTALRQSEQTMTKASEMGCSETQLPSDRVAEPGKENENQYLHKKYVGNVDSMKFHRQSCQFARIMARARRIDFEFRKQAVMAGMKPCNWCLPQWWTNVQAELLVPPSIPKR